MLGSDLAALVALDAQQDLPVDAWPAHACACAPAMPIARKNAKKKITFFMEKRLFISEK
jgi:hypothetical protein